MDPSESNKEASEKFASKQNGYAINNEEMPLKNFGDIEEDEVSYFKFKNVVF